MNSTEKVFCVFASPAPAPSQSQEAGDDRIHRGFWGQHVVGAQEGSKCYAATLNAVGDGCRSSQAAWAEFPVSYEAPGAAGYFPERHRSPEREPSLRPLSQEGGPSISLVK